MNNPNIPVISEKQLRFDLQVAAEGEFDGVGMGVYPVACGVKYIYPINKPTMVLTTTNM